MTRQDLQQSYRASLCKKAPIAGGLKPLRMRLKGRNLNIARVLKMANYLKSCYESLPIKLRLFTGMLLATLTAGLAIYLSLYFTIYYHSFVDCIGVFLAARVILFMANPAMPLTDENVQFMSSERTLWNSATIVILAITNCLILLISLLMK